VKIMNCTGCGSKELIEEDGLVVCAFCMTKYVPDQSTAPSAATSIHVGADVHALIMKARHDPPNAGRYYKLVLDLDPTNAEARAYLYPVRKKKKWF